MQCIENWHRGFHGCFSPDERRVSDSFSAVVPPDHPLTRWGECLTIPGMRETITFRPKRPRIQLKAAFGNVSEKLNELIERELSLAPPPDWRDVLKRPAPLASQKAYELCLRPE